MAQKSVLMLFDLQYGQTREVWSGVLSYVKSTTPWILHFAAENFMGGIRSVTDLQPDGVISNCSDSMLQFAKRSRIPAVTVNPMGASCGFPQVTIDDQAVGGVAAEYFLERGFEHFGFIGNSNNEYSNQRERGFCSAIEAAGFTSRIFDLVSAPSGKEKEQRGWSRRQAHLARWLRALPCPTAILVCNDLQAWRVAEVCRAAGLQLPEEISLLGAGNEQMFCESVHPPLSSIALPSKRIGFEAAALLDRLMNGTKAPVQPVLLPPLEVVTRQSTDALAIKDADVARALALIRAQAAEPISVEDILLKVPVSRRGLERKFVAVTGRTILEHIIHAHVERAKVLLTGTELPIGAVAVQAGFQSAERMSVVFRQRLRMTPTAYRKKFAY